MDLNMTYWLDAVGIGTGVRDFVVQVIAGIVAGVILIVFTILVTEPRRDAKVAKIEEERTAKQNKIEDERIARQNKREDEIRQREKEAEQKTIKLKELHEKLLLYKQYYNIIINVINKLPSTRKIDNIDELKLIFEDIKSKTIHRLDFETDQCRIKFEGTPTENTLTNFHDALKSKIADFETEIEKI